jgi:hypothetical protein
MDSLRRLPVTSNPLPPTIVLCTVSSVSLIFLQFPVPNLQRTQVILIMHRHRISVRLVSTLAPSIIIQYLLLNAEFQISLSLSRSTFNHS